MEVRAVVQYRGGLAHYNVVQEHEGIFLAMLARYDGRPDHHPPAKLNLVKGLHSWTGSYENQALLDAIGKVIDKKLQSMAQPTNQVTQNVHHQEQKRI